MAKRDTLKGENEQSMAEHRLSEDDTRAKLIDPSLRDAGWREEYIRKCYEQRGTADLQRDSLTKLIQVRQLGSIREVGEHFGGTAGLLGAFLGLQEEIYRVG